MPTEPQPLSDSLRATLRDAGDCHDHTPDCSCLPIRVVVDQHGHYWRDYGDNWSMCPVSTENVATEPVTEFHRAGEGGDFEMDPEKIALARLELEVEWAIQWLESGRTDQAEGDAATAARLRAALAATSTSHESNGAHWPECRSCGEDWPCEAATPTPDPVLRDALDVERLARAIVKACREQGERLWPRDGAKYHGHGWPAYSEWTNGRNTTADLVVSDLAASILAYLAESTPTPPEAPSAASASATSRPGTTGMGFTPGCTSRRAPLATRSGPRGTSHPAPSAAATWTVPTPTAPEAES